jgi:hypothetical protein
MKFASATKLNRKSGEHGAPVELGQATKYFLPILFALLIVQFVKDPTKPRWPECYSTGVRAIPVEPRLF